ncbi:MAG: SMC family ATPase [Leptolyngbyaceae bacterium]|nr:SMC family ATPase [Leptolyngbyaceae bacterium]
MQILSVTLKNFKSHRDRHFLFQLGTNAICGENGAGKTSILEAIAWTLFNYRGDYRKEDLICNGEGSAQVTVSFISNRDGRTYDVQRCTSKGYMIYDPQLDHRLPYTRIDEDVLPWLRQQMGVAPGTDLARLFSNTIGVPQGTFTADFLQSAEKRKQVFDSILKVEEFKRVYTQLASLKKYSDGIVDGLKREIEHYDSLLAEQPAIQQERDRILQVINENQITLKTLDAELASLQAQKDQLSARAQHVQALAQELSQVQMAIDAKQRELGGQQTSVTQAKEAVHICQVHQEGHDRYMATETVLRALEDQGKRHRTVLKERDKQQKDQSSLQVSLATLASQLEALKRSQHELDRLTPFVQQQEALERQQAEVQQTLETLKRCDIERCNLEQQVNLYRGEWKNLAQEIRRIQALESDVEKIPVLEHQRDRLQLQISRVDAAQQFEHELRQLVTNGHQQCDRLQQDVRSSLSRLDELQASPVGLPSDTVEQLRRTLESGVSLNTELLTEINTILSDVTTQVSAPALKTELASVKKQLGQAYRAQAEVQTLAEKQTRQHAIQTEAEQFQTKIKDLSAEIEKEPSVTQKLAEVTENLRGLNDPRGQCRVLAKDLSKQAALEASYAQQHKDYENRQLAIAQLDEELQQFATLDEQIEAAQQQRQQHQSSYQLFLQHQPLAAQLCAIEAVLATLTGELETLTQTRDRLQQDYDQASQDYDPDAWSQLEKTYGDVRSRADQIRGSLPEQQKRLADYDARLTALQETQEKRDRTQRELKSNEQVKRFVNFARKVYKDAGPRITERYVLTVSREADRLFRELLNRQNVALTWSRNYEILVQEGAHQRRFVNLSGGEQMCAALAVRLALLRVLADIDIAFFDEPTTNMDRPRRASLAEAIANIKSFQQLFVISHDDTFEQFTENLVLVEREPV